MSEVKKFYAGCSVFMTGATGFLGAIMVEKLVRSCPDIKHVYILIRERNGLSMQDRLNQLLAQPVFQLLNDELKSKIVPIQGQLDSEQLGLSQEDLKTLMSNVSVIFHVAAYINFNSPLFRAVEVNVLGTRRVLHLAKSMPNIKSFVYVSTAYANCVEKGLIEEKVYPCKWTPDELVLIKKIDAFDESELQARIIENHPNPYSFTKLMAENVVQNERGNIPVAIVRPSIVLGTLNEPLPGWFDNVNAGQIGFIVGALAGLFRTLHACPDTVADLVPSDMLASSVIASAFAVHRDRSLKVYHFTSGQKNQITWGQYCKMTMNAIYKYPIVKQVMHPRAKCRPSILRNKFEVYISHYLPAFFIDLFAPLMQKEPILLGIQKKYAKGMAHARYFTVSEFKFSTSNMDSLLKSLSDTDKEEFNFDVTKINWNSFMETCVLGARKFYFKEDLNRIEKAKKSSRVDLAVYIAFWLALIWIFWAILSPLGSFSLPIAIFLVFVYFIL